MDYLSSENEIRKEFSEYRDPYGLIQPYKNPGTGASGNGVLYTAEYIAVLWENKLLNDNDEVEFLDSMWNCEVCPGLIKRSPTNGDQEGPDDYIGITAASWMLSGFTQCIAENILEYGEKNNWVYNNVKPGTNEDWDGKFNASAQMGRFPAMICHFYWCAKKTPPMWRQVWWVLALLWATAQPAKNHDNWILSWFMVQVAKGKNWFCDCAISIFEFQLKRLFPGGMKQLFSEYFQNPEHPISKYFVD